MKYDGRCLHGASPGQSGDCTLPRKEDSVLCEEHHKAVIMGWEKAPPLRLVYDYVSSPRRVFLVEDLPPERDDEADEHNEK